MATDPKKDELKEQDLENVSGGDKTPDPHETPWAPSQPPFRPGDNKTAEQAD